jgi:hypothetical protein
VALSRAALLAFAVAGCNRAESIAQPYGAPPEPSIDAGPAVPDAGFPMATLYGAPPPEPTATVQSAPSASASGAVKVAPKGSTGPKKP